MATVLSPLRYPGSKQKVISKIRPFWDAVRCSVTEYREPFLGGASIFLNLDTDGKEVWLNDKDPNISTLFSIIRDNPDELSRIVTETEPTIEQWMGIKYSDPEDDLSVAFRTLFLNRTNYSGILSASPIGGFTQSSKYPISCRWNASDLSKRISQCSSRLVGANVTSVDFFYLIIKPTSGSAFLILDPPYYEKGNSLYDEGMSVDDHLRLRDLLVTTPHRFLLTYDDCEGVRRLYRGSGLYAYETGWYYSVGAANAPKRNKGRELFITNIDIGTGANLEEEGLHKVI